MENICFKMYFNNTSDVKAELLTSLLQSSVSHDPSEILQLLICCSRNISYHIENGCAA